MVYHLAIEGSQVIAFLAHQPLTLQALRLDLLFSLPPPFSRPSLTAPNIKMRKCSSLQHEQTMSVLIHGEQICLYLSFSLSLSLPSLSLSSFFVCFFVCISLSLSLCLHCLSVYSFEEIRIPPQKKKTKKKTTTTKKPWTLSADTTSLSLGT